MKPNKKLFGFLITLFIVCTASTCAYHAVDKSLSEEDKQFIPKYLENVGSLPENPSYSEQLNFIVAIQNSVLNVAPRNGGLPLGQKREPKELLEAGIGLCFDRSRVIEKILIYHGFETRHISIYSKRQTNSTIKSIITPGVPSHAVTEVYTKNGWLIVDSNAPWVSIDTNNQPVSIESIQYSIKNQISIQWRLQPPTHFYVEPFAFIYGLYSRHGRFYPPYNFIPDIHYGEFIQNI